MSGKSFFFPQTHFELTNDDSSFWSKFADQQKSFQEKYNSLSPEDLFEGFTYDGESLKVPFKP